MQVLDLVRGGAHASGWSRLQLAVAAGEVAHCRLVREGDDRTVRARLEHRRDALLQRSRDDPQLRMPLLDPPHVVCVRAT
jgi:hypothetical protein